MQQATRSYEKELITSIAVKRMEIARMQKELLQLENEQREELTRRYCSE